MMNAWSDKNSLKYTLHFAFYPYTEQRIIFILKVKC